MPKNKQHKEDAVTDNKFYKKLDFINNLVKPWDDLCIFLLQPYSLDPKFSTPVINAASLVVATAHQFDVDKNERGESIKDKKLRDASPASMRIKDLCNTIKHVSRNQGCSAKISGISAQIIIDHNNKFCFLRNQIAYQHEQDGEFDLLEDLKKAIYFWAERRDIDISDIKNWNNEELKVNAAPPSDSITLFYDPSICIHQKTQGIKLFKIGYNGELIPTDHDMVFHVIGVNNLEPFASVKINKRDITGVYV